MRVEWLSLADFRSYHTLEWKPDRGVNLLIGPNGAGKTNVLEAIGYLASLRSFRSVPDNDLIKDDADTAVLRAGVGSEQRDRLIEIEVNREAPRRTQVDKTRLRRTADLLGALRVIAFLPDDLDLVKRGPAYRRDLLDAIAVQLWPAAHLDQSEYDRALRQRNAFLRSGSHDDTTLGVWDSRLSQAGGRVLARRSAVLETLAPLLAQAYEEVSQETTDVALAYRPSWTGEGFEAKGASDYAADLSTGLLGARRHDYERRTTTVGPHRDEPGFRLDSADGRTHGSQGEQRTLALAVKLAAHRAVAEVIGEPPVLLLDDVFSELDQARSKALAATLPAEAQTIITSARLEDVPVSGASWAVGEGLMRQ